MDKALKRQIIAGVVSGLITTVAFFVIQQRMDENRKIETRKR